MPPHRKVMNRQLEVLLDVLEKNKELATMRVRYGRPSDQKIQLWTSLAKKLNALGPSKSAQQWRRYWIEFRCKSRKKAREDEKLNLCHMIKQKTTPLTNFELRAATLLTPGYTTIKCEPHILSNENDIETVHTLAEPLEETTFQNGYDSDSDETAILGTREINVSNHSNTVANNNTDDSNSQQPKWAIEFEERRVSAEEKMANALSSIAALMRSQEERRLVMEERRLVIEERITDALTTLVEKSQDLSSGIQEAIQQMIQLQSLQTNSFV